MGYRDLRDHLAALESAGLLVRVKRPIDKDTELHPLVRWQFRGGIPEDERKGFLFEQVVDQAGRQYTIPVAVAALAASRLVYAVGAQCQPNELRDRWLQALAKPIPPVQVDGGPCQEEVHVGADLEEHGGLGEFPIPISTPGFDNGPYTTCSSVFTRDPETGIQNCGTYRGQVKSPTRIGVNAFGEQDIMTHWRKAKDRGLPLEAAIVVGGPPVVLYASVQKVPFGVDEMGMAGALAGMPIRMVKCVSNGVEVPAESEVVIEGLIPTDSMEPEGPFGESHGYVHPRELHCYMNVTAITHRRNPIWVSFISQLTPSESSLIKRINFEPLWFHHLSKNCRIGSVLQVILHEPMTNLRKYVVVQLRQPGQGDVWRALHALASFHVGEGRVVVAVDEDIDPRDHNAVLWAMCNRMRPTLDCQIVPGLDKGHQPPFAVNSTTRHDRSDETPWEHQYGGALLINATLKDPFPPVALPARPYMERARVIWEELGLPALHPESPWFGYSLGQWDDEAVEEAELALQGRHYEIGEKLARQRVTI